MMYDLVVIGGGPAGMLGAATAGARGLRVVLLEKNDRLGRKLSITGNGRCNVTNCGDFDDFQRNVITNGKFLYSTLNAFGSRHLMELLHSLGVRTRIEGNNRVFPASNSSGDVIKALQKHLQAGRVEIRLHSEVKRVLTRDDRVDGVVLADNSRVSGKNVLIATGGMSYRQTGSAGDGYQMAVSLGHTIIKPRPALVPLVTGEAWVKDLQGLALEHVKVQALKENRCRAEQNGDLLFTHFGVSGPAVLNLSSLINKLGFPLVLRIDLKPGLTNGRLGDILQEMIKSNPGRHLKNSLGELLPQRMLPVLLGLAGVDGSKQVDHITRTERERLAYVVKNVSLTATGPRPLNEAIVTSGGINIKEINASTLESKIIKGLYFAGEVMDVDALTGGYNLQIAFSTGHLCGTSIAG